MSQQTKCGSFFKVVFFAFFVLFDILKVYYILTGVIMTNVKINDPWFESLYKAEFNSSPIKFLETFKSLLADRNQREKKIVSLLKQYEKSEMSVGKIAEELDIDRDKVLSLMERHNIYLVDYDLTTENKTIEKYLVN